MMLTLGDIEAAVRKDQIGRGLDPDEVWFHYRSVDGGCGIATKREYVPDDTGGILEVRLWEKGVAHWRRILDNLEIRVDG